MYMSDVNQQGKSIKVATCIYEMPINKENVLKLLYVYVGCQSTSKSDKVSICIYQMPINKKKVLKFRYLYIRCQSTRKKC